MRSSVKRCLSMIVLGALPIPARAADGNYRLPPADLKDRVIWGGMCEQPEGGGLSFGGQDQEADLGQPATKLLADGQWKSVRDELRSRNPLQATHDRCAKLAERQKDILARARRLFFEGAAPAAHREEFESQVLKPQRELVGDLANFFHQPQAAAPRLEGYDAEQARYGENSFEQVRKLAGAELSSLEEKDLSAGMLARLREVQVGLEILAEALDAEPPGRALSPIAYDPRTKLYVLFGGDHLDYLTNDTWVFDPAAKKWRQRHPILAPPPRANHTLKALGDGTIALAGGYTYASNTDYMGGQYRDVKDGEWTYDVAADTWSGSGNSALARTYRTGPFLPEFFFEGQPPNAAAFAERLKELPPNTWVATKPPRLPQLQRDWGTAVLDPDHDLILRFSGGHCAHGGSDVLQFHLSTNLWELPFPVEFPLGQLYSNTSYPDGFNLNQRPWVTGHTYQNYGYDATAHEMLFTGRDKGCYLYDPTIGDWTGRLSKPSGMSYNSCFYTLTVCPTPQGLACWTSQGQVFRFDAASKQWMAIEQQGGRLPGSSVDNSTVVFDAHRNRLLFARKDYGDKVAFDGQLHALDLATGEVAKLSPAGSDKAGAISYLCQLRYDAEHDLLLVGGTLPPDGDGLRRTPAYDCQGNRWVSLKIVGDDPSGKTGRNVSLGMMYDEKRKLFWAVDTHSNVFVLRLDPDTADLRPLE